MLNRIAEMPLIARLCVAALAGVLAAFGQAPYDQPIAMLLALAFGFALWRIEPSRPGLVGWVFGTGYFALALSWIVEPFQVDVARHGWMAPFALIFLSAGLALFWGLAFWLARRLFEGTLALVFTWTGAEIVRAYIFTGFPWASPAQVMVDGPISSVLALGGPHGATLIFMCLAWTLSVPARSNAKIQMWIGQGALLCAVALTFYLPIARPPADETGYRIRLVQPNAAQHLKWQPDMAEVFFQRQLTFSSTPPDQAEQKPDLIVWPETAIPWRLDTAEPVLQEIARAAGGAPVALGGLRFESDRLFNAMAVLDAQGGIDAIYDKHHLVPFGEYIPFAPLFERFGLQALAANMGGFTSGSGPALLDFGPLGTALPLICYEAVFAHGVGAAPARPSFLLQVTNDAWFGKFAGPQQHLAQARMRSIEQGLPMVRAANTGISALIDPFGRVVAQLPLQQAGFLDVGLPKPSSPTVYARTGDWPAVALILIGLVGALLATIRRRRLD